MCFCVMSLARLLNDMVVLSLGGAVRLPINCKLHVCVCSKLGQSLTLSFLLLLVYYEYEMTCMWATGALPRRKTPHSQTRRHPRLHTHPPHTQIQRNSHLHGRGLRRHALRSHERLPPRPVPRHLSNRRRQLGRIHHKMQGPTVNERPRASHHGGRV